MKYIIDFLQFMSLFVPVFVTYGLYKLIDEHCGPTVVSFWGKYKYWQFHNFLRVVFFIVMVGISLEYYSFIFGVL